MDDAGAAPISGYDQLKEKDVVDRLRDLSQVELEAVEAYERAHEARPAVLNKLRYMRSSEPLEGYDSLDADGVAEALDGADARRVKAVRDYERKFQNRRQVIDETARVLPDSPANPEEAKSREEKAERVRVSMRRSSDQPPP